MCTRHRQLEGMGHLSVTCGCVHKLFSTVHFFLSESLIVLPFRTAVLYLVGHILVILFPHLVEGCIIFCATTNCAALYVKLLL